MRLLLEKNNIHLGNIMRACQSVIEMISSTHSPTPTPSEGGMEIEENEEEGYEEGKGGIREEMKRKFPRIEENAWMLLMLISKVSE